MTPHQEEYRTIPLTQGQFAIVSSEDYQHLSQFKWHASRERRGNFYAARRTSEGQAIFMHRVVCNTPEGKITDHINRDTLDNRRDNLRAVTAAENQQNRRISRNNTSGYLNVSAHKRRWKYSIMRNGKVTERSGFATPKEAYEALQKIAPTLR